MNAADPLAALRPLHLPAPVGWWPPAPGWWLLAALALALLAAATVLWLRAHRRNAYRRGARRELAELYRAARAAGDARAFASGATQILRRAALCRYPPSAVARLCAEDWLAFLDRSGRTTAFSAGAGRALAFAPYDPAVPCDLDALHAACRDWLRRHR
jgi:hypothetical protein